jgi:hypothetical protein
MHFFAAEVERQAFEIGAVEVERDLSQSVEL